MRFAHTMIRVASLEKSTDFYVRMMGLTILRRTDYVDGRFTNLFLVSKEEYAGPALELTFNWDHSGLYEKGTAWGHLAFEVDDLVGCVNRLRAEGVFVSREPGPMKGSPFRIAFVRDPDGYAIEMLERLEEGGD